MSERDRTDLRRMSGAGAAILLTFFAAVNCGGPASEQGGHSDKKEPQPGENQSGGSSGSGGGVHFAGAPGSGGCKGECGGSLGGLGGGTLEPAVECVLDIDCPSAGPCHEQVCSNGTCQLEEFSDGTPCSALCLESGSCNAGQCVGTRSSSQGELVDTLYGFGAGEASKVAMGQAHFSTIHVPFLQIDCQAEP